jgi:hypothetical protein
MHVESIVVVVAQSRVDNKEKHAGCACAGSTRAGDAIHTPSYHRSRTLRAWCVSLALTLQSALGPSLRLTSELEWGTVCMAASSDLLVVGPGVLGSQVGSKWLQVRARLPPTNTSLGFGWVGGL